MMDKLRQAAVGSVLEPNPHYRTAIGLLGISLPLIVISLSLVQGQPMQDSISAYYYSTAAGDWFVGILWVIGVFLFFYRFTPSQPDQARSQLKSVRSGAADSVLGKIAGPCAVVVALFPTMSPTAPDNAPLSNTATIHLVAAVVLFGCLSLFPLLLFSQAQKGRKFYRSYGCIMLGILLAVIAYAFAGQGVQDFLEPVRPILLGETLLIWVFGISWFHKGCNLAKDRKEQSLPPAAPMAKVT